MQARTRRMESITLGDRTRSHVARISVLCFTKGLIPLRLKTRRARRSSHVVLSCARPHEFRR